MKRISKQVTAAVALALCLGVTAAPALAADVDQDTAGDGLSTAITFDYKDAPIQNDPTYTVVIPETITLTEEGAPLTISAENVANLDGRKISVTIAGTDQYRNQMTIQGKTASGSGAVMRYQLIKADGTVIETTGTKDQVNGVELAAFTENGSETLTMKPVLTGSSAIKKDVVYTGTINYGIALADLAE